MENEHRSKHHTNRAGYTDHHRVGGTYEEGLSMEEMRKALWHTLEDVEHSLAALEETVRILGSAGAIGDKKTTDNVMWHIAESISNIRAQVDEGLGITIDMKTTAA